MKAKKHTAKQTRERGFSLVTVLLIGMLAVLWTAAMAATVLPVYQKVGYGRNVAQARMVAEAAVDYAVDQLNASIASGSGISSPSSLDATAIGTSKTTTVPASVYGSIGNATVTVTVQNLAAPSPPPTSNASYNPLLPQGSSVYNAQLDINAYAASSLAINTNLWRVIQSTAQIGPVTKNIRVVLAPDIALPTSGVSTAPYASSFGMFGTNSVSLGPLTSTDGYNSANFTGGTGNPYNTTAITSSAGAYNWNGSTVATVPLGGDIASYGSVSMSSSTPTLSGYVSVGGSATVSNQGASASSTQVATGTGGQNEVSRYLNVNGTESGFSASGTSPNVLGASNTSSGFPSSQSQFITQQASPQLAANQLPPAPSAPNYFQDASTTTPIAYANLGDVVIPSGVTVQITNSAALPSASNPISIPTSGTYQMAPGNYIMSSLTIESGGRIFIDNTVNPSVQPVRFFLEGTSDAGDTVNIAGTGGLRNSSMASNGATNLPMGLQIYSNGTGSINIGNSRGMSGVVYAPNASINLGSPTGAAANFYGSFIGQNVSAVNANIHFDQALSSAPYLNSNFAKGYRAGASGPTPGTTLSANGNNLLWQDLRVVSWQEY